MSYRITFDRVGRNHAVEPITTTSDDPDTIAQAVYNAARPHLMSRDVEVVVDLDVGTGTIFAGFHVAGTFNLEGIE